MTKPLKITFAATNTDTFAKAKGKVCVLMATDGKLSKAASAVDKLTGGALKRLAASDVWDALEAGSGHTLSMPAGMDADALQVLKLDAAADPEVARKAGAAAAVFKGKGALTVLADAHPHGAELAYGLTLRSYNFNAYRTGKAGDTRNDAAKMMVAQPAAARTAFKPLAAIAEGVLFTRDLTNEPANVLTTTEFAKRLSVLKELGVQVEVMEETKLKRLGMRSLLAVGQGSASPSKVVVMKWNGGPKKAAPFALVGKGVVFDTGGISLKPSAGMEDMTMDMGGAGVVSGVMMAVAKRKAKANVIGVVGLVENMPDGEATRPGDVVASMKGDTIEIINTDAEGRLVLADILWYTQEQFKPAGMINLATLTGAMLIALGHENAGVFSNDDGLADAFLAAAEAEGEGAWRMPMGPAYDKLINSKIADIANTGGRMAGSITAAQFLKRFVKDDVPWCHLDIAGVASVKKATEFAPKGATGWGVRALDRLIRDTYEA
ncbi:leucyl aminopeptidase [Halovulum sp. GXIMD14793]